MMVPGHRPSNPAENCPLSEEEVAKPGELRANVSHKRGGLAGSPTSGETYKGGPNQGLEAWAVWRPPASSSGGGGCHEEGPMHNARGGPTTAHAPQGARLSFPITKNVGP